MRPLILLALAFVASPAAQSADLDASGLDRKVDAKACSDRLFEWTKSQGLNPEMRVDDRTVFLPEPMVMLAPVFRKQGIDSIVVYVTLQGNPGNVTSAELAQLVNQLNRDQVAAQVSVASSGGICFVMYIHFDDKLDAALFRKFIAHCREVVMFLIEENPRLKAYIR
jgi:hypothetical protein